MTTVAYASSVRPNVNVMLLKVPDHSSKEEEMLTPRLVSMAHVPSSQLASADHVAILSQREHLFQHRCYLHRHFQQVRITRTDFEGSALPRIHRTIREPPARMNRKWSDHRILMASTQGFSEPKVEEEMQGQSETEAGSERQSRHLTTHAWSQEEMSQRWSMTCLPRLGSRRHTARPTQSMQR